MPATLEKLQRICSKNPTSILFARLADALLARGDGRAATEICRNGLRYRPSYVAGHLVMGKCHLAGGRIEEARHEFQKVLQLEGDYLSALWRLAAMETEQGHSDLAETYLRRAQQIDPFDPRFEASLNALEAEDGDRPIFEPIEREEEPVTEVRDFGKIAKEVLETTDPSDVEERPLEPIATCTLAELYAAQGRFAEAVAVLERVSTKDPENQLVREMIDAFQALQREELN